MRANRAPAERTRLALEVKPEPHSQLEAAELELAPECHVIWARICSASSEKDKRASERASDVPERRQEK